MSTSFSPGFCDGQYRWTIPFNDIVEELALHPHVAYAYTELFTLEFDMT
jgi:hypothetical protein